MDADVIVVGGGLSGLVAASELVGAGKRVAIVDQENAANLGGQAFWSFGGIFMVNTPQQRHLGVRDSFDLAWQDWQGSAGWDRLTGPHPEDEWAARWGRAYVEFAAGDERPWLQAQGVKFTPLVGWAERGDGPGRWSRQLGAALPCAVGIRHWDLRAVRGQGKGGSRERTRAIPSPPPSRRARLRPRHGDRRPRCRAGPRLRRSRCHIESR